MLYTSQLISDKVLKSSNEGFVEINGKRNVFMLYNKPKVDILLWQSHKFLVNLEKGDHIFKMGTVVGSSVFRVDNITLEQVLYSDETLDSRKFHVKAHAVFLHDWSSIHADWHYIDEESEVVEYIWAIGLYILIYSFVIFRS